MFRISRTPKSGEIMLTRLPLPLPKRDHDSNVNHHAMERVNISAAALRKQIFAAEEDLAKLKTQLAEFEAQNLESTVLGHESEESRVESSREQAERRWPLSSEEYQRYGRQMIVPNIGIQGQLYKLDCM